VLMAVTHSVVHGYPNVPASPGEFLRFVNARLCRHYTTDTGRFVSAFYCVYDPTDRTLTCANAGHPPPRVRSGNGHVRSLQMPSALPLGIDPLEEFEDSTHGLGVGDAVLLYTDGITEAADADRHMLGVDRLDETFTRCDGEPQDIVNRVLSSVRQFTGAVPASDDRTLIAIKAC
jgi:phosphoserine phosphatase RsbU/P